MELLAPTTATVVASDQHPAWGRYAAVTRNTFGKGEVIYVGFMPTEALTEKILAEAARRAGIPDVSALRFPTIVRSGVLRNGLRVRYLLNHSSAATRVS